MWIKNKEPYSQPLPYVQKTDTSTTSQSTLQYLHLSLPPPGLQHNQHPAVGMTVQSQELDSGQETMPGLLPGAFRDQRRELGLFTSTSFTFKIIAPAFSTIRALCVWCGAEANPCLKRSLCYGFRPRYNFVFSVVYTVSKLQTVLRYDMTERQLFNLSICVFFFNPKCYSRLSINIY